MRISYFGSEWSVKGIDEIQRKDFDCFLSDAGRGDMLFSADGE